MKFLLFCLLAATAVLGEEGSKAQTVAFGMGCLNEDTAILKFPLPKADWASLEAVVTAQVPNLAEDDLSANPVIVFAIEQQKNVTLLDGTTSMQWTTVDTSFTCEGYSSEAFECYHMFDFNETVMEKSSALRMTVYTAANVNNYTVCVVIDTTKVSAVGRYQAFFAAIVFVAVFVGLAFNFVHMTLAVLIGDTCGFFLLWIFRDKPSLADMVSWIDEGTIGLLMAMMMVVAVFAETGFFEVAASSVVKFTRNRWMVCALLSILTAVASAILDNTTTVLLFAPVSIKLAGLLHAPVLPFLVAMIFYCTIGGAATYVGDPPNLIIGNVLNFSFMDFIINCSPCAIIVGCYAFVYVYFLFKKEMAKNEGPAPKSMNQVLGDVEMGATHGHGGKTEGTPLIAHDAAPAAQATPVDAAAHIPSSAAPTPSFQATPGAPAGTASDMVPVVEGAPSAPIPGADEVVEYRIKDKMVFYKAVVTLCIMIIFFTLESVTHLSTTMVALIGCVTLLTLVVRKDITHIVEKVEWPALLFFAGLFVLVKMVDKLGLIRLIGNAIIALIASLPLGARLPVAIIVIIWVSAFVAAFCNNIAYTASMLPLIMQIGNNPTLGVPMRPLAWALALGVAFSANGSLVGAAANLVVAQIAHRAGHPISFMLFLKWGMPLMILTIIGATVWCLFLYCICGYSG
ncbi:putative P protein [Paratrimastix pyriformis]|uniref:P protein n=1 Tax=Paratrimastix pyriformis TaxID=342808 RepID=A0ABQ8UK75_9EUKA|nr:putative P protein [Paratrimastix pyriformis]